MAKFHVEGYFEGEIEADSAEEARAKFDEMDIDSLAIRAVYEDDDE